MWQYWLSLPSLSFSSLGLGLSGSPATAASREREREREEKRSWADWSWVGARERGTNLSEAAAKEREKGERQWTELNWQWQWHYSGSHHYLLRSCASTGKQKKVWPPIQSDLHRSNQWPRRDRDSRVDPSKDKTRQRSDWDDAAGLQQAQTHKRDRVPPSRCIQVKEVKLNSTEWLNCVTCHLSIITSVSVTNVRR